MNMLIMRALLAAGLAIAGFAAAAEAQDTTKIFVDINLGAQTQSRSIESSTTFPLYGETAAISTAQSIDSGGLFDFSVGYRVIPTVGVALGLSRFSSEGEGSVVASIPSPVAFNRAVSVTDTVSDLEHKETVTHLMFTYFYPIKSNIDVSAFIGPSFFRVSQDIVTASIPNGTQSLNVGTETRKANATGLNIGFNINYMVTPNYGGGVFMRYAGATAELENTGNLKVGGFQLGIGLRARF